MSYEFESDEWFMKFLRELHPQTPDWWKEEPASVMDDIYAAYRFGKDQSHISFSRSATRIHLFNLFARLNYVAKLGLVRSLSHSHVFKRWTSAQNLLCWCGAVKLHKERLNIG